MERDMKRARELLERVLFQFGKWHMQAEYDWDSENDLKEEIRAYLAKPEVKRISDPDSVDLQSRCRGDKL